MSSESIQQGARGPQHEPEPEQHVVSSQEAATPLSVRRKRNVVLHQLSLAVGTVQRVNVVLRDIDALTAPQEEQSKNDHDDDDDDDDDDAPMAIEGRDTNDARTYAASGAAEPHETRESQASLQQARSISVKQRLLVEELKRWKDA
jgi:hypothetical protein